MTASCRCARRLAHTESRQGGVGIGRRHVDPNGFLLRISFPPLGGSAADGRWSGTEPPVPGRPRTGTTGRDRRHEKIRSAGARRGRAAVGDTRPRAAGSLTLRFVGVRRRRAGSARGFSCASRDSQQREQACSKDFHGAPPLGPLPPSNLRALGPRSGSRSCSGRRQGAAAVDVGPGVRRAVARCKVARPGVRRRATTMTT